MKRAIGYIRISTKDQSNFSMEAQEDYVREHCRRMGWELLSVYRDDGQSAKNFDRANWKELEKFIKQNYRDIDYVVVPKYDRFSRNVHEALRVMEQLEREYRINVLSVAEQINVHPESPMFIMQRMQTLMMAEYEWQNIRERTRIGQRRGAMNGRWLNKAPFGYLNQRDVTDKPVLAIDEGRAVIIRKIYSLYLGGMQMTDIGRIVRPMGFTLDGNSAIERVLRNPVYCGLVKVPAMYDEPEQVIDGLHTPIIDKASWAKVQQMIDKPVRAQVVVREEVPLRGELRCHCGKHFTAGPSVSKSGKHYWYYFCPDHRKANLSAKKLHGQFDELIGELSLGERELAYLQEKVMERINAKTTAAKGEIDGNKRALKEVVIKLEKLEEKYVLGDIPKDSYDRMATQWRTERSRYEGTLEGLMFPTGGMMARHKQHMHLLGDMHALYNKATVQQKQQLIRVVFDSKLYYEEGVYRTPYVLGVFAPKLRQLKEKRLLYIEQPLNVGSNSRWYPQGELLRTKDSKNNIGGIVHLLETIEAISRAS